jgi:hypothetical protein
LVGRRNAAEGEAGLSNSVEPHVSIRYQERLDGVSPYQRMRDGERLGAQLGNKTVTFSASLPRTRTAIILHSRLTIYA